MFVGFRCYLHIFSNATEAGNRKHPSEECLRQKRETPDTAAPFSRDWSREFQRRRRSDARSGKVSGPTSEEERSDPRSPTLVMGRRGAGERPSQEKAPVSVHGGFLELAGGFLGRVLSRKWSDKYF